MGFEVLLFVLAAVAIATASTVVAVKPLHLLQLESYQIDGYHRACKRQKSLWKDGLYAMLAMLAVYLLSCLPRIFPIVSAYAFIGIIGGADGPTAIFITGFLPFSIEALRCIVQGTVAGGGVWLRNRKKEKKPLIYTPRVKRLVGVLMGLNLLITLTLFLAIRPLGWFFPCVLPALQIYLVWAAARIVQPFERRINMGFFRNAQCILRERPDLIKVAITGSYGKTSTKFILATILAEKYNVLATPASFNTPMGLTRIIREQLRSEHEIFIAEMGARHVGDIAELCELVCPTMGILTSIGPQHLETFYSIENVARTKFELINALPPNGEAIFAWQIMRDWPDLVSRHTGIRHITAGIAPECDIRAYDISTDFTGSNFSLSLDGTTLYMHTKLLGAHNIDNIALCCAAARRLGLTPEQIIAGVAKVEPIEHRLQLIRGVNGNTVIDDAFNSNPAGARAALDVLTAFPGRKIIVTPGMVELGSRETELNRAFGRQIADVAEIVILIGLERSHPIKCGLRNAGFAEENLYIVSNLDEATGILAKITRPGDVTLFENDLPDNYEN